MPLDLPPGPFPGVHVARTTSDTHVLRRAHAGGELLRVRQGAYVAAEVWNGAGRRERSILTLWAISAERGFRDVVSHESAAILHGLPLLHEPQTVHFTSARARSTRSRSGVCWHAASLEESEVVDLPPFRLSSPERTIVDILSSAAFADGVAVADAGLRTGITTRGGLDSALWHDRGVRGRVAATRCLEFAREGSANPGESLSRVAIAELGFVEPELQVPFRDAAGSIGVVDFWWEGSGVVGEFDGFQKYADPGFLSGRTPSQVVVAEKARERRLEALPQVRRVARWVWSDVTRPHRLHQVLSEAGVGRR